MVFANPADWPDDTIRAIPDQSVWRIEFFHVDGARPNVVQTYRTVSRAQTLAEVAATPFAGPTAAARAALIATLVQVGLPVAGLWPVRERLQDRYAQDLRSSAPTQQEAT